MTLTNDYNTNTWTTWAPGSIVYRQRRRAFGRHEYRSADVVAGAQRRHLAATAKWVRAIRPWAPGTDFNTNIQVGASRRQRSIPVQLVHDRSRQYTATCRHHVDQERHGNLVRPLRLGWQRLQRKPQYPRRQGDELLRLSRTMPTPWQLHHRICRHRRHVDVPGVTAKTQYGCKFAGAGVVIDTPEMALRFTQAFPRPSPANSFPLSMGWSRRAGNGTFTDCSGIITLTGTGSDYGGSTKINGGTMVVGANVVPVSLGLWDRQPPR